MSTATVTRRKSTPTGIAVRHQTKCATRRDREARCNCEKSYRGGLWNAREKRNDWGPWTHSQKEAEHWRAQAIAERAAGRRSVRSGKTLSAAVEGLLADMASGVARERTGKRYKAATIRSYSRAWRLHIEPDGLGPHRLSEIRRADWQAFVDRLAAKGLAGSTIRNILNPVQVVYRRAIQRDEVSSNPTLNLELPAADGQRERFATREEAARLLAALPIEDRALWATAFYAGLRRGELRALRWRDINLGAALIAVSRSWDDKEGEGETKSKSGLRRVPIVDALADALHAHAERTGSAADALVFGTEGRPFEPSTARRRALAAWARANAAIHAAAAERGEDVDQADMLVPITLHECRHTFASLMIAAGVNAKALSAVMGHASIAITFDRYGKLMPGAEGAAGDLLSEYLRDRGA